MGPATLEAAENRQDNHEVLEEQFLKQTQGKERYYRLLRKSRDMLLREL